MPRPIKEKIRDFKWWGEQVAHAVAGAVVAIPFCVTFSFYPDPLLLVAAQFAACLAGQIRELVQNWNDAPEDNDLLDSHFDAIAFGLGAFVAISIAVGLA